MSPDGLYDHRKPNTVWEIEQTQNSLKDLIKNEFNHSFVKPYLLK